MTENHPYPELECLVSDNVQRHTWSWGGRGLQIFRDSQLILDIPTRFTSRDGLRIVDALDAAGIDSRVQSTDHGCGRLSVQVISANTLSADIQIG